MESGSRIKCLCTAHKKLRIKDAISLMKMSNYWNNTTQRSSEEGKGNPPTIQDQMKYHCLSLLMVFFNILSYSL